MDPERPASRAIRPSRATLLLCVAAVLVYCSALGVYGAFWWRFLSERLRR